MKKFLQVAWVIGTGLVLGGAAQAADVYNSYKDSPRAIVESVPAIAWTGFYFGGQVGYGNANHEVDVNVDYGDGEGGSDSHNLFNLNGLNSHGVVGGVYGGFDWRRERIVMGALAGYTWTGMETTFSALDGAINASLEKQDEWYVGGRIGALLSESTLLYVGAAYVATEYEGTASIEGRSVGSISRDYDGVKALAGIETNISGGLFAKLEYQHDFYGDVNWFDDGGVSVDDKADEDKILFGVHYKFGINGLPGM